MQWSDLITAVALVMVIEGMLPFINPRLHRSLLISIAKAKDRVLRLAGLVSMVSGLIVLYFVR